MFVTLVVLYKSWPNVAIDSTTLVAVFRCLHSSLSLSIFRLVVTIAPSYRMFCAVYRRDILAPRANLDPSCSVFGACCAT